MNLISIKCPECGATLEINEDRKKLFCAYCGQQILLDDVDENSMQHVDETVTNQMEANKTVQSQDVEEDKSYQLLTASVIKTRIIVTIVLGVAAIVLTVLGYYLNSQTIGILGMVSLIILMCMWLLVITRNSDTKTDMVKVPSEVSQYKQMKYKDVERVFLEAGFSNTQCVPLHDVSLGILAKSEYVKSIQVNGIVVKSGGKKFKPDASVIISYHSQK